MAFSQTVVLDTITRSAPISIDIQGNRAQYNAQMPPLNQVAGAPKAYYSYYWETGDGNYSFKEKPKHSYKKAGDYEVRLWSTNNYDNGKPPASRPKKVTIAQVTDKEASTDAESAFAKAELNEISGAESSLARDTDLMVRHNREPIPEQEIVLITSYRNTKDYTTSGKLYLFYNDRAFKDDNFKLIDTRLHHDEKIVDETIIASTMDVDHSDGYLASTYESYLKERTLFVQDSTKRTDLPLTLEQSRGEYRNSQVITFDELKPGEERNIFRTLETTPEMLKDTSAIVTLRSIFVPDDNYENHSVKDTELEIVTSHDPNKMSSNGTIMNYRLVRFKRLKFKVRFQNDGEGPANTIKLEVDTPEMFDRRTLEVTDMYPKCPICPKEREVDYSCLDTILKKDKIIFTFKKIYLPGTAQKNVTDKDSTKGFVKYSMKFGKDFHKTKTRNRTAIYFDKNPPIYTNYSTTRFLPGISIGVKAGTIFTPSRDNASEYFAGVTLSPFKSYRGYFQAELFLSASSFETLRNFETSDVNDIGIESLTRFSEQAEEQAISTYLVPISYRYNLNNILAVGAGVQLKVDLSSSCDTTTTGTFSQIIPGEGEIADPSQDTVQTTECDKGFGNFQSGLFIGANVGGVRIGPSAGVRYVWNFNEPTSQIQLYGIWKF
ncbi:PKD domain-containing protein [Dokdonia sinensis]|uniref:PKD domain-containing protein n=2 Tax=Dokdonia sinensis TaxID=2479847 RepID=A0A3M0FVJ1_9FLAO|nr:PKD domain-containing protein [Dokdonia sinensis]